MTGCSDATKFHKLSKTGQSHAIPNTSRKYHGLQERVIIQLMVWPCYQTSLKQIRSTKPYWKAAGSLTGHAGVKTHPGNYLTTPGIYLGWDLTSHFLLLEVQFYLQSPAAFFNFLCQDPSQMCVSSLTTYTQHLFQHGTDAFQNFWTQTEQIYVIF